MMIVSRNNGYTCPNCKIPISRKQIVCLSCGAQLRNVKSSSQRGSSTIKIMDDVEEVSKISAITTTNVKDWWCKKCGIFVEMQKDFTPLIIIGIIYLIAIVVGFIAFFPWGGLVVLVVGPIFILFFSLSVGYMPKSKLVCNICGKKVRKKKMSSE